MDDPTLFPRLIESVAHARTERRSAVGRVVCIATGVLALMASATTWSANEKSKSVVLWEGQDQWVRIEPQDSSAAPNDHPVQLSAEEVSNALSALRIRATDKDSGTETQRAAFTRPEIANLAPQVVAGLGKANAKQDVTFSTIGSHAASAGALVKDPAVNAGRVFYQGGKLNVIFGELQTNYRKKNIYGQRSEDFTPRRQGSRDKASKQTWAIVTSPGIDLHAANGGAVRDDWVMIDPVVAGSPAVATPEPSAAAPRQAAAAPETTPAQSAAPGTASASASAPPAAGGAQAPAAGAAAAATQTGKSAADLEQRLQALKDLKDKGLISEEAYNSKVKELLSEL